MALHIGGYRLRCLRTALSTFYSLEAHRLNSWLGGTRNILSEAYYCREAWQDRLRDPLLRNIEPDQYFVELSKKFGSKKKASAVDVDIYLNRVTNKETAVEFENVLNRLRRSRHTVQTLPSTHTAAVRYFLDHKLYDTLVKVLRRRLDYGVFPDTYTSNQLMDTFLEEGNHRDAVKVAIEMMLQEDLGNEISRILAVYACHMYLREPKPEPWDPHLPPPEEDDGEEIFVRVPNITNPFFDDHFDLNEPHQLVGKSLMMFCEGKDDLLHRSYYLVGCGLYQKWEKAAEFIRSCSTAREGALVTEGALSQFRTALAGEQVKENIRQEMEASLKAWEGRTSNEDLHDLVTKTLEGIPPLEAADIDAQKRNFVSWQALRQDALEKQTQAFLREQTIEAIKAKKEELGKKEELLYAFENWNQIEMQLAEVEEEEAAYAAANPTEEVYIPPDVRRPAGSKQQ